MNSPYNSSEERFYELWNSVKIVRSVPYTLFTFGESDLPYFLVVDAKIPGEPVEVSQGTVKVARPMLITPYNMSPEFQNLFEEDEYAGLFDFVMARTAAFSNLKISNQSRKSEFHSDSVAEVVARLNERFDAEQEDRVAILTAPYNRGPLAVFKYTTQRILESAPGNIQELREKGFLPD
ncbi:MAG: hypothetical protein KDA80_00050 [Planctomycetaceae bacterium]|nr:hypothetical protein [Planctomycetaceae bacterium]